MSEFKMRPDATSASSPAPAEPYAGSPFPENPAWTILKGLPPVRAAQLGPKVGPYLGIDVPEHVAEGGAGGHEPAEEAEDEPSNPVADGLRDLDLVHLAGETALDGKTGGEGLLGLMEEMGEDSAKLFSGEASAFRTGFGAAGAAVFGPAAVAGGIMEMHESLRALRNGDMTGAPDFFGGAATTGSGLAAPAAVFGSGFAATAAPVLATFAASEGGTSYGNKHVKELGWLHDDMGEPETASEWAADNARTANAGANQWLTKHTGSDTLGTVGGKLAGGATLLGSIPPAAAIAIAGAFVGGGEKVGNGISALGDMGATAGAGIAHATRAAAYAGNGLGAAALTGVDGIGMRDPETGNVSIAPRGTAAAQIAGEQMADYDDDRDAAIARSKLLHPERWGEAPNQVSMVNEIAQRIHDGTHKR